MRGRIQVFMPLIKSLFLFISLIVAFNMVVARAYAANDELAAALEAERARQLAIKTDCRNNGARSCDIMAREIYDNYDETRNFEDLKSAILASTRACGLEARYCLLKGDLLVRSYKDGLDIDTWLPGRYIREEVTAAYMKASNSGDLTLSAQAYYNLAEFLTAFGLKDEAAKNYAMSCKIGGTEFCLKSGSSLEKSGSVKEAIENYSKACDFGDAKACLNLGKRFYAQKKIKEGNAAFEKACSLNEGEACHSLAIRYQKAGNRVKAREAYGKSCNLGYVDSCVYIGAELAALGESSRAYEAFNKACNLNNGPACHFVGGYLRDRGDSLAAQTAFAKACNLNHAQACYELGLLQERNNPAGAYNAPNMSTPAPAAPSASAPAPATSGGLVSDANGVNTASQSSALSSTEFTPAGNSNTTVSYGTPVTTSVGGGAGYNQEAISSFKRACDLDQPLACYSLARAYSNTGNINEALTVYRKACDLGREQACFDLGVILSNQRQPREAAAAYEKSCKLNNSQACFNLAMAYQEMGNDAEAFKTNVRACKLDVPRACFNVGIAYANGKGVKKNNVQSRTFLNKACKMGDSDACLVTSK